MHVRIKHGLGGSSRQPCKAVPKIFFYKKNNKYKMPFAYSNDCNIRQIGTACVRGVIAYEYNGLKKPRMNSTIRTHIRSPPSLPPSLFHTSFLRPFLTENSGRSGLPIQRRALWVLLACWVHFPGRRIWCSPVRIAKRLRRVEHRIFSNCEREIRFQVEACRDEVYSTFCVRRHQNSRIAITSSHSASGGW